VLLQLLAQTLLEALPEGLVVYPGTTCRQSDAQQQQQLNYFIHLFIYLTIYVFMY